MLVAAPIARSARPPIVRPGSETIGQSQAVRATVSRASSGRSYIYRFRIAGVTASVGDGCVATARVRLVAAGRTQRVALAPAGVWCAGSGLLSVVEARRGAVAGLARVRVRTPLALGQGNVIGHLLLGPTCPVERVADPCDPVANPAPTALAAVDASGRAVARTVTLRDGSFAFTLAPGSYVVVRAEGATAGPPSIADASLTVAEAATSAHPQTMTLSGDTGIR